MKKIDKFLFRGRIRTKTRNFSYLKIYSILKIPTKIQKLLEKNTQKIHKKYKKPSIFAKIEIAKKTLAKKAFASPPPACPWGPHWLSALFSAMRCQWNGVNTMHIAMRLGTADSRKNHDP